MLLILSDLKKNRRAVKFDEAEIFFNQDKFTVVITMNVCEYTFTFVTLENATNFYTRIVEAIKSNYLYLDTGEMNLSTWTFTVEYEENLNEIAEILKSIDKSMNLLAEHLVFG